MKFIKKHIRLIIIIIILVLLAVGIVMIKDFFLPTENKVIYGSRLEGIKKVPITEEKKKQVQEALKEGTTSVKVRLAGRIIYITIKVDSEASLESAKALGNKGLEVFSDEEKKYYDIQYLISSDTNTAQFPIIGYKHHTKDAISWTRDRSES